MFYLNMVEFLSAGVAYVVVYKKKKSGSHQQPNTTTTKNNSIHEIAIYCCSIILSTFPFHLRFTFVPIVVPFAFQ
jgi:hypothetical protein